MKILVACEESQRVCTAFRNLGHEAYSCDLQPCSGGHPEWHIIGDVEKVLHKTRGTWDLIIAHPPCTYLTVSGNRWFNVDKYGEAAIERQKERAKAIHFFKMFVAYAETYHCRMAIENPIGVMSTVYRKPDQIIQPWQFGHPYTKSTCLWLFNLPKLVPTNVLEKPAEGWANQSFTPSGRYGGFKGTYRDPKLRSKTFTGISQAMAEQWGNL